jgi:subtilisin family serine protease
MRTLGLFILLTLTASALWLSSCCVPDSSEPFETHNSPLSVSPAEHDPERFIVTLDRPMNDRARAALASTGSEVLTELSLINGAVVLLPSQAVAHKVRNLPGIVRVEVDAIAHATAPPGKCTPWPECKDGGDEEPPPPPVSPPQALEWGVDRIDADLAWNTTRGTGVRVAVLDTGIDRDHEDLVGNLVDGINFTSKNPRRPADPSHWDDDNGHGTHCAGIIGAEDNEIGVVGVAPEVELYAVKVLDRSGSGYVSWIISGLEWAVANDIDVVNLSLSTSSDVQALHDAVDAATEAGVTVIAAAGNSGDGDPTTNTVQYPARYASTIAIAATDFEDGTPYWSSEGAEVDVAAPGVNVHSTWNDGMYDTKSGTSMASPHVAGVAALLLAMPVQAAYDVDLDGAWSPAEIRTALIATADDLGEPGHDMLYGHGLVDAEEAVTGIETNP